MLLLALAITSAAWADVPPDPPPAPATSAAAKTAAADAPAPSQGFFRGHARRPIFLGLLAAAFLIIGALAGANDRPGGDRPKAPGA